MSEEEEREFKERRRAQKRKRARKQRNVTVTESAAAGIAASSSPSSSSCESRADEEQLDRLKRRREPIKITYRFTIANPALATDSFVFTLFASLRASGETF